MKLNTKKLSNYIIHAIPNVEFVNPIEFDFNICLDIETSLFKSYCDTSPSLKQLSDNQIHELAVKKHLNSWEKHYKEIMAVKFPNSFFNFSDCGNKKRQELFLSNETYDFLKMQAIFYRAWLDYNYTFSCYRYEKRPKIFDDAKFPDLYYLQSDNTFDIIGNSNLREGQLKGVLEQRNIVIAKFLDNGNI